MNTTENNKLIAEFIGFKLQNNPNERFYKNYFTQANGVWGNRIEILHFDSDWNWLMQVVEKINDYNNVVKIHENHVKIVNNERGDVLVDVVSGSMLEAVYNACVEFIKWYNNGRV